MVDLRAQWSNARHVVLLRGDAVVAASVVEAHAERAVLEVPILAAAKAARQQGYGSVLVATLIALGVRMRLKLLLVSATAESHGFWLRQGLHTPAYCSPAVRAMLRTVDQAADATLLSPTTLDGDNDPSPPSPSSSVRSSASGVASAAAAAAAAGGGGGSRWRGS